jgi:hypothetical protein
LLHIPEESKVKEALAHVLEELPLVKEALHDMSNKRGNL